MKAGIFAILLCLCAVCSCEGVDGGTAGVGNPLSECVIPSGARPGEEAVIQWNGFAQTAAVVLKSAGGKAYPAEVKVVTSSGLIFRVPSGLAPGSYSVVLSGEGTILGTMEVYPADIPIAGLSFPTAVLPGDSMEIRGVGFDNTYRIVFRSSSTDIEIIPDLVSGGMRLDVPSTVPSGIYSLVLKGESEEWILDDSFLVTVKKRLESVQKIESVDGGIFISQECIVEYEDDEVGAVCIRVSYVDAEGNIEEVSYEDRYLRQGDMTFSVEDINPNSESNNFGFRYECDPDGSIVSADVHRFSSSNPAGVHREFGWSYDSVGNPTDVTYSRDGKQMNMQWYTYESENLVETKSCVFVYDNDTLKNHPFAVDAGLAFDMMRNLNEPFLYVPYLIRVHTFASRLLPSRHMEVAGPTTRVPVPFTYKFDSDGYVTEMSWNQGSEKILFHYQ